MLTTPRLLLRSYQLADATALQDAITTSLPELRKWMPWAQKDPTLEGQEATILHFQKKEAEGKEWTLGLFLTDGTFLGSSGYRLEDAETPEYEIGYWLDTRHTGKGYATEAVKAQTSHLFQALGANRVSIHCQAENHASASVAKRLGYICEGRLRNHRRHMNGSLSDTLIFAHTPESWQQTVTNLA